MALSFTVADMDHVISRDGTSIAFHEAGSGPPLIVIGGALADHATYLPLADKLASGFNVLVHDRRGRGLSGDKQPYAVAREIDDIAALIERVGAPVDLYGHSSGAALALRAAAAGLSIRRLLLGEPPFSPREDADRDARAAGDFAAEAAQVEARYRRGDHRSNAAIFLASVGIPGEDVESLLASPAGAGFIDGARALRYEYAVLGDGLVPLELAARVAMPVFILTTEGAGAAMSQLAGALPRAEVIGLPVSVHEMAPQDLAAQLMRILSQEGVVARCYSSSSPQ